MKKVSAFLVALLVVTLPIGVMAMEGMGHEKKGSMDHGKMDMDHGKMDMEHGKMQGMAMDKDTIMLGEEVEDGVKGMAHLKDVSEAMAKMGMKQTHHFAVMFMDGASGEHIESGSVAVKIEYPSGEKSEAIQLMGMQGHFGADVTLPEKGEYHFKVGTKLADGKKRQYHYHYPVK